MQQKPYNLFVGSTTGSLKGVVVGKNGNNMKVLAENLVRNKENLTNQNEIKCVNWNDERETEILIGMKNTITVYDTSTTEFSAYVPFVPGESCGIFSADETLFVGSTSGTIHSTKLPLQSVNEWTEELKFNKSIECLKRSSFKSNIIGCGGKDNDLKLWDLNTRQMTFNAKNIKPDELQIPAPVWVSDILFCRNSEKVTTCMRTGYVRIFDPLLPQRRPVFNYHDANKVFTCISETPMENQFLVGCGSGDIFLLDVRKKSSFAGKYKGFCGSVKSIACPSGQSLVLSTSLDRFFRIHDFTSRKLLLKEYMYSRLTTLLTKKEFVLQTFEDEKETNEEIENSSSDVLNPDKETLKKDAKILDNIFAEMETIDESVRSASKKPLKGILLEKSKRKSLNETADSKPEESKRRKIKWKKTV